MEVIFSNNLLLILMKFHGKQLQFDRIEEFLLEKGGSFHFRCNVHSVEVVNDQLFSQTEHFHKV